MLLRRSVKGTIGHVIDSVLLRRDLNRDPDCYRANSIYDSNDNNSDKIVDDLTNLGDDSLYYIFRCGSKRCQFQSKFIPVNSILSTATKRLYKCIVSAGLISVNNRSSNLVETLLFNFS